jgi:hypothetical protein
VEGARATGIKPVEDKGIHRSLRQKHIGSGIVGLENRFSEKDRFIFPV